MPGESSPSTGRGAQPWRGRSGTVGLEADLDQRAVADHTLQVVPLPGTRDVREDPAPFGPIVNDPSSRQQVGLCLALDVKAEMRIRFDVQQPPALPRIRASADLVSACFS